jgi:general stress protein YciG
MASNKQGGNSNRGFASMDSEKQREIASKGGKSSQGGGNSGNKQSGDTSNRGFASMDPQRQREIASEGGKAAHASGNAHEFTSEEAREAGKLSHSGGNRQSGSNSNKQGGNR